MEMLRIPQERVAVLIGSKGEAKKRIERTAGIKLKIDEEGRVQISSKDTYKEYVGKEIVKAVARGFSPDDALRLLDEDKYLRIIDLKDELGSENAVLRQKARIIGENGRTKKMIEECSGTHVCVYGATVALIGEIDELDLAYLAVSSLLEGKPHSFVYKLLEHGRRTMKEERIAHMWEPVRKE